MSFTSTCVRVRLNTNSSVLCSLGFLGQCRTMRCKKRECMQKKGSQKSGKREGERSEPSELFRFLRTDVQERLEEGERSEPSELLRFAKIDVGQRSNDPCWISSRSSESNIVHGVMKSPRRLFIQCRQWTCPKRLINTLEVLLRAYKIVILPSSNNYGRITLLCNSTYILEIGKIRDNLINMNEVRSSNIHFATQKH